MKYVSLLLLGLLMTGCGTTAPQVLYRPGDLEGLPARLVCGDTVALQAANGVSAQQQSLIPRAGGTYDLAPGTTEVEVVYYEVRFLDGDEHETLRSEPVTLSLDLTAGKVLHLEAKAPADLDAARAFVDAPEFIAREGSGQVTEAAPPRVAAVKVVPDPAADTRNAPNALQLLHYWWGEATLAERRRFMGKLYAPADPSEPPPPASRAVEQLNYWFEKASEAERGRFVGELYAPPE